ncbi:hypothetical protein ABZ892_23535, partial [Streptomyces sp. NPDC046924]
MADEAAIPVVIGDMTTAVAPGGHDLVRLAHNTPSDLFTRAEQAECFRNAARRPVPGGRFVIGLRVPEPRRLPPGQEAAVWQSEPGRIGLDTYGVLRQRVVSHHFRFDGTRQARLFRSPHRSIRPAELDLMAQPAGFDPEAGHADRAGAPFTAGRAPASRSAASRPPGSERARRAGPYGPARRARS